MKTKKINLHWQSVLLGMVLCMVLVVFLGSKADTQQATGKASSQATGQDGSMKAIIESTDMQKQMAAMDKDLARIEKKIDEMTKTLTVIIKVMWPDLKNK